MNVRFLRKARGWLADGVSFTRSMATTSTKRIWWDGEQCQKQGTFPWVSILDRSTPVHPYSRDAWRAFDTVLRHHSFSANSVWAYVCRIITGGRGYSLHAYGIATDVDPSLNRYYTGYPRFDWAKTTFTREMVDALYRIKTMDGKRLFMWGGYWISIKDYMHWELDVSPTSLATGIDWSTVDGYGMEEIEMLKKGDSGPAVGVFQDALMLWEPTALPEHGADDGFGDETVEWVKKYQEAAEIPVTGMIGDVTGPLLGRYVAKIPAGLDGKDGAPGLPGKDGAPGLPGKDGTPGKVPSVLHATEWK